MYSSTMFGIFGLIVLASFAHALSTKEEKALEEVRIIKVIFTIF
jgi:hypothetical protein